MCRESRVTTDDMAVHVTETEESMRSQDREIGDPWGTQNFLILQLSAESTQGHN